MSHETISTVRTGLLVALAGVATAVVGALMLLFATGDSYEPLHATADAYGARPVDAPAAPRDFGSAPAPAALPDAAPATLPDAAPAARWSPPEPAPVAIPFATAAAVAEVDPSWQEVRLAHRDRELGAIATYVKLGLREARQEMAACFEAHGVNAAWADDPDAMAPEPARLVLQLEARGGAVEVVDAVLESRGDASPYLVECGLRVLRGYQLPAANTVPGQRYRLKYVLQ